MAVLHKTDEAQADVKEILIYLERRSAAAAERFADEYDRVCERLASQPGLGRSRDELRIGIRSVVVQKYIVFYCPIPGGVSIIRVVNGARDLRKVFDESEPE